MSECLSGKGAKVRTGGCTMSDIDYGQLVGTGGKEAATRTAAGVVGAAAAATVAEAAAAAGCTAVLCTVGAPVAVGLAAAAGTAAVVEWAWGALFD
ncbi:hypothetical protein [Acidithiobacillus caldus]|nr:hypothetical protein [Acidithiobacillus caldus]